MIGDDRYCVISSGIDFGKTSCRTWTVWSCSGREFLDHDRSLAGICYCSQHEAHNDYLFHHKPPSFAGAHRYCAGIDEPPDLVVFLAPLMFSSSCYYVEKLPGNDERNSRE